MRSVPWSLGLVLFVGSLWVGALPCQAAGGGVLNNPGVLFTTDIPGQPRDSIGVRVQLPTVLFKLNTVQGKYRVAPVLIENRARTPVALSRSEDTCVVLLAERSVPGILDLSRVDRALWDALDSWMRKMLAYPDEVGPEAAVMIYVFIPDAIDLPRGFDYTIKALGRTLPVRPLAAAAE